VIHNSERVEGSCYPRLKACPQKMCLIQVNGGSSRYESREAGMGGNESLEQVEPKGPEMFNFPPCTQPACSSDWEWRVREKREQGGTQGGREVMGGRHAGKRSLM
jgi:hypothetical protein